MLLASPVGRVGVSPRWGIPNTLTVNDLKLLQLSHQPALPGLKAGAAPVSTDMVPTSAAGSCPVTRKGTPGGSAARPAG